MCHHINQVFFISIHMKNILNSEVLYSFNNNNNGSDGN